MTMDNNCQSDTTRDRLLDEAERLFAERGFYDVTVRQITTAAECNTAAVNYHFGGKSNLYLAVFRERWAARAARLRAPIEALEGREDLTLELALRTFLRSFLRKGMTDEERLRHSQLIMRELSRPTEAFQLVAEEALNPMSRLMHAVMLKFLPDDRDELSLRLSGISIFSMAMFFTFARQVVTHITGRDYDEEFLNQLEDHLYNFTVHGLGLNDSGGKHAS